jgi:sugar phosphate isomerase/epimerase
MNYIVFSKLFKELSIDHLAETLKSIGADGVDLCVRDGYPVNPGNARKELPKAVHVFRDAGLSVQMITAPTSLTSATNSIAENLFRACHDAGVQNIKLGYWGYKSKDYWKAIDSSRKDIEGFAVIASRFGVKACLHTHSGANLGLNASSLMHQIKGFNPSQIGAYLDPGHLALCGEPPEMAIDIVGEYLSLIAVKDSLWEKRESGKPARSRFLPLGEGIVDWHGMQQALIARNYAGPLSFHSEYEGLPTDKIIEQTKKDLKLMREIESSVRSRRSDRIEK